MKIANIIIVDNSGHGSSLIAPLKEFLKTKNISINFDVFGATNLALSFLEKLDENVITIVIFSKFPIIGTQGTCSPVELYDRLQPFKDLGATVMYFSSTLTYNQDSKALSECFDYYEEIAEIDCNKNLINYIKKRLQ